jgi:hypothetical protein
MEGMWPIEFATPGRLVWHGIAVFAGDQMFGSDPYFYWYGTYTDGGGKLEGTLQSFSHTGLPVGNILGQVVSNYSMRLSASAPSSQAVGTTFSANGPAGLVARLIRRA